jgi:hypothetical protein
VETAWTAVNNSPDWKQTYQRLCERMPKPKAIVAVARKLLVAIWHVLTGRTALSHNDPLKVAKQLMVWGYQLSRDGREGLTVGQFVRQKLDLRPTRDRPGAAPDPRRQTPAFAVALTP